MNDLVDLLAVEAAQTQSGGSAPDAGPGPRPARAPRTRLAPAPCRSASTPAARSPTSSAPTAGSQGAVHARRSRAGVGPRSGAEPATGDRPGVLAHGTTVATNALLERRGAAVALVTTAGSRDVIEIARQDRPSLYDQLADRPEPLVPRARASRWRAGSPPTGPS